MAKRDHSAGNRPAAVAAPLTDAEVEALDDAHLQIERARALLDLLNTVAAPRGNTSASILDDIRGSSLYGVLSIVDDCLVRAAESVAVASR